MNGSWTAPLLVLVPALALAQAPDPKGLELFEQKIRPVLVQHCYECHSQDAVEKKKLKAELLLDSSEGTLNGGESGPALVKGKPDESLIIKALKYDGLEMPPTGKLSDEAIADFRKWIELGAPDPRQGAAATAKPKREINLEEGRKFWSFRPLIEVKPPEVAGTPESTSAIDRFVQAEQAKHGVKGNGPASKQQLIRRAYFDLIGLPPTPEEVDAFVADETPQAFEKVIDHLLASEHYGERWARHWLDAARYAESNGYEFDAFRPGAFHYRDWVIRSLNNDMPYDQFMRMQLAGDKLQPDTYDGAAAVGFLVAGPYPGQITAKTVERIRYDQIDDMLMTIGGSMLGLTLGCVRCHDHKFDPLPQTDYYSLAASLAPTVQGTRNYDPNPPATQAAIEKHRKAQEPLQAALEAHAKADLPKRFTAWQKAELGKQPEAPRWQVFAPIEFEAERSWLKVLPSGVIAHDGAFSTATLGRRRGNAASADQEVYRITVETHQKNLNALRLDAFTDKALPQRGPGLGPDGSFNLGELTVTARPLDPNVKDKPIELKLTAVFAAFEDKDQPIKNAVDGNRATSWLVRATAKKDNAAVFEINGGLPGFAGGTLLEFRLEFRDTAGIGRLRLSLSTEPNPATWAGDFVPQHLGEIRAVLAANKNTLPEGLRVDMARWFAPFDEETSKVTKAVADHIAKEPRPPLTEVYTTKAGGQDVYLLRRGEVDNKLGKASPGVLQVLLRGDQTAKPAESAGTPPPATDARIAMGDWITDVEHGAGPLAARVIVNRLWQHHFGEGLVGTPNDFGAQGEAPSHPDLLEWLAHSLVSNGWKLKPLHKQIMLSAAYRQGEEVSSANLKADPTNRYLWHHKPQRLEAEVIRDALLAVGGTLDRTMFGASQLDNSARRSIYLRVKRSELIPLMTMFDAPEPTQSIGERISTTVPTQALAMMNSAFVRTQAERLAQRVRPAKDAPIADAVDRAYRIAFSRLPTDAERTRMLAFIEQQKSIMGGDSPAVVEQALTEFCQVLLCLNEFVYVD